MNNIYEELMFSVLRIECLDKSGDVVSIGTGFLLLRPVGDDKFKLYLVSNKHVLCDTDAIQIVFTENNNGYPRLGKIHRFNITNVKPNVFAHPNHSVDVAALECTSIFAHFSESLFCKMISYEMLADFNEPELSVAENVIFIGFPDDRFDEVNNLPLIRTGLISSHPKYDYNGDPKFVIDAQVFPGSSGSPVFIDLSYENFKNGQLVIGKRNIKLLGVVSATMVRNNELQAVPTGTSYSVEEVLGLGIVYKSTTIKELIDSMPIDN